MSKFEYKALDADTFPSPEQLTNDFGNLGWKLLQIIPKDHGGSLIYFIREKEEN